VKKAFTQAGIGPRDISLIELQDNTVYYELAFPEEWGFCEPGEAEHLVERGDTMPTGKLPINPSGGFLCFGEATTAMGVWQMIPTKVRKFCRYRRTAWSSKRGIVSGRSWGPVMAVIGLSSGSLIANTRREGRYVFRSCVQHCPASKLVARLCVATPLGRSASGFRYDAEHRSEVGQKVP
jgi:hypothetical protein